MILKGVAVGHEGFTLHGLHNAGRNLSILNLSSLYGLFPGLLG